MCIGILFCSRSLTSLGWRDVRAMLAVWSGEPQINPASLELASIATPHVRAILLRENRMDLGRSTKFFASALDLFLTQVSEFRSAEK